MLTSRVRAGRIGLHHLLGGCAVLAIAVAISGCGSSDEKGSARLSENATQAAVAAGLGTQRESIATPTPTPSRPPASRCVAAAAHRPSSHSAYAAVVKTSTAVLRAPRPGAPVVARVGPVGRHGFREVLGVIGARTGAHCAPTWYRVQLPVLPNGTTGWVRATAVKPYRVRSRIVVDLSRRSLRLYRAGKVTIAATVAVGAAATPTPQGRFFVNERYVLPDASGPFGPNALGISAHSPTLQDSWVENGPIAIHGTNEPWSLGRAASHGCIRVSNDVMRRVFALAPAGTPVVVTS